MSFTKSAQNLCRMVECTIETIFKKSEHKCWYKQGDITCVDLYRVRNKDTSGNQIEWVVENEKIHNSIFTFKEDAPIEKRKECNRYELLTENA